MAGFFAEAKEAISREIERFRNRQFLEAVMAAAALVATVDGEERFAELHVIDEALETVRSLRIYDPHHAVDIYRDYVTGLGEDPAATRQRALKAIARIAGDGDAGKVLLKVALAIGKSDSELSAAERTVLVRICDALGVPRESAGV